MSRHTHVLPAEAMRRVRSSGIGVTHGSLKPEPTKEQPVLLQLSHLFSLLHVFLDLLLHTVENSYIYY